MDRNDGLSSGLAQLSEALREPGVDLEAGLHRLDDYLSLAVASYLGMTIILPGPTGLVSFTSWHNTAADHQGSSSLLIPLPLICATEQGSSLILYAGTAGAFIDLAADLSWTFDVPLSRFVLDEHLSPAPASDRGDSAMSGLADFSLVNQAIGVLIADGYPREAATDELRRRAEQARTDLNSAAATVMDNVGPRPPEN